MQSGWGEGKLRGGGGGGAGDALGEHFAMMMTYEMSHLLTVTYTVVHT